MFVLCFLVSSVVSFFSLCPVFSISAYFLLVFAENLVSGLADDEFVI